MISLRDEMKKTLNHQPCVVPMDFGGSCCTGIHVSVVEKLREYYQLEKRPVVVDEYMTMLGRIDDDLRSAMGIGTVPFPSKYTSWGALLTDEKKLWGTPWGQQVLVEKNFCTSEDARYIYVYAQDDPAYKPAGRMPRSGYFFDAICRLDSIPDELNPEDNLEEYTSISDADLDYLEAQSKRLALQEYPVIGNFGGTGLGDVGSINGPGLKEPKGIRDVAEWYMALLSERDYVKEVFERQTDIALENLKKIYRRVGNSVSMVLLCGTDFGTQTSQFCSPATFDDLYKPYYRKITDWIHSNTEWKCAKHCCGAIRPLIPNLIDSGFDVLNPVQLSAANMDMYELKREFGNDLVFWGAGVDTQKVLPFGTPDEVRKMVLETLKVFSKNGGFIFSSIHNVQAKTPVENIAAMVDAYREFFGLEV